MGTGPVGTSLACALDACRVALIGPAPRPLPDGSVPDSRVYALSPGNVEHLRQIGAWQRIDAAKATAVRGMEVYGDREGSVLRFDAYECGVPELAWTVEDARLQHALWDTILTRANVQRFTSEEPVAAALVVGADGAASAVRERAGIHASHHDYHQSAVVANFACEADHCSMAYQWFRDGAVLALLPLAEARVSMVWSLASDTAARIAALDSDRLCAEVEHASGGKLGKLSVVSPPRTYPLRQLRARRLVAPGVALVGDAAHVIHPLAGQGLNLGLQDARCLARLIGEGESVRGPGDWKLLRRYERERAEPILTMDLAVDGLHRLFGTQASGVGALRNAGLNLADRLPVLKNLLMRHAMR